MTLTHSNIAESSRVIRRKPFIYIVDTNILYTFLEGQAGFGHSSNKKELIVEQDKIRKLFKTREVVIPQAAMVEIMGQYFHIRIDLDNYDLWYRKRKTVFNNLIINYIFSDEHNVRIHSDNPGMMAMEISQSKISKACVGKLRSRERNSSQSRQKRLNFQKGRNPKLLDGIDSLIIATGIQVANENSDRQCVILSNDKALAIALENLKECRINNYVMPENIEFRTIHVI